MGASRLTSLEWEIFGRLAYAVSKKELIEMLQRIVGRIDNEACRPSTHILLGEICRKWNLGQTAAQFFFKAIVCCAKHGADDKAVHIPEAVNEALSLVRLDKPDLGSLQTIAIYCAYAIHQSLQIDGFDDRECRVWIAQACRSLKQHDPAGFEQCVAHLADAPAGDKSDRNLKEERWVFREYLIPALHLYANSDYAPPQPGRRFSLPSAVAVLAVVLCCIAIWNTRVAVSASLLGANDWATAMAALLTFWPVLLVVTWLFGRFIAKKHDVYYHISPDHYLRTRTSVVFGEIISFRKDHFFHIFQFVWILFLIFSGLILAQYAKLPDVLASLWNPANPLHIGAQAYIHRITELADGRFKLAEIGMLLRTPLAGGTTPTFAEILYGTLWNDGIAITAAAAVGLVFLWRQYRIQHHRLKTGLNFYWWDWRIDRIEWVVRCTMVGLDMFLVTYLVLKLAAITSIVFDLSANNLLLVNYFHPDGTGGLEFLQDLLARFFLLAAVFSCFTLAMLYHHRNMPEYRRTDLAQVVTCGVLSFVLAFPLILLQQNIQHARAAVFASHTWTSTLGSADQLQVLQTLRDWHVSIIGFNYLSAPFFLLAVQISVQIGFVLWQNGKKNRHKDTGAPSDGII